MRGPMHAAGAALLTTALLMAGAPVAASDATEAVPAGDVAIEAPSSAAYKSRVLVRGRLTRPGGEPVADERVLLQRQVDGTWRTLTSRVSDAEGRVRARPWMGKQYAGRDLRARWKVDDPAGARSEVAVVDLRRQRARLTLRGPARLRDERRARLRVSGVTGRGADVLGTVRLLRRTSPRDPWTRVRAGRLRDGRRTFRVRPRVDTFFRVTGAERWWYRTPRGDRMRIDNVPPGRVIRRPEGAPWPSVRLPAQRRAVGGGLNPRVTRIGNRVWSHMVGRSWHRGCPVGRPGLRIIRLNYWGFDGYRHRGEIVVNADVTTATVGVFRDIYRQRQPIRAMYRVDRFGWSDRLKGANDYRSMSADNTSAFNCRQVVGRPGRRSPHSYGRSIDLNPWENPYVTGNHVYPNRWWLPRDRPGVMVHRSYSHPVVEAFGRHGFSWGGSFSDFHHFQD